MISIAILIVIAGAIGGLIKSFMESNGRVVMPSIEIVKDANGNEVQYVHLGFVANLLLGGAAAFAASSSVEAALTTGMATAFTAEKMAELKKAKMG